MSNINILQFQEDPQLGKWRNLYHSVPKRSANIVSKYLRMSTHKIGEHIKKYVWTKIPLILYLFVLFLYTQFSRKATENSGVLLNCFYYVFIYIYRSECTKSKIKETLVYGWKLCHISIVLIPIKHNPSYKGFFVTDEEDFSALHWG